mgnify:CR=1 FL=1
MDKDQIKEITTDDLKAMFGEWGKEMISVLKEQVISEVKSSLPEVKAEKTKEEKAEESKSFLKGLCDIADKNHNSEEAKALTSLVGSMGYSIPTELSNAIRPGRT